MSKIDTVQAVAQLKAQNEKRWLALFNRQGDEIAALDAENIVGRVHLAMWTWKALKSEKPDSGLSDYFKVVASPKLTEELMGRCQLRERKALAKSNGLLVAQLYKDCKAKSGAERSI